MIAEINLIRTVGEANRIVIDGHPVGNIRAVKLNAQAGDVPVLSLSILIDETTVVVDGNLVVSGQAVSEAVARALYEDLARHLAEPDNHGAFA